MEPGGGAREIVRPVTLPVMGTTLQTFAPHIIALLAGGLVSSLGMTHVARRERAAATLVKLNGWVFALVCFVLAAGGGAAAFWQLRSALAEQGPRLEGITPAQLLLFGLVIGIPLALPGVVFAWSDAHAKEKARKKRRDFVPTKDDRRKFADDVVRQIKDVSPKPRELRASVGDDGGRVLMLDGEIDAQEGERLTAALRADLAELAFKRVEGKHGTREWWSRV